MKRDVLSFEDFLRNPEKFSWGAFVYAAIQDDISTSTKVVVVPDFDPDLGKDYIFVDGCENLKFSEFLAIDDILQIKENLKMQNKNNDVDTIMKAVKHYFENDAFIDFSS